MEWEVGWSGYGVVLSPRAPVGTSNTVRPNFEYRSAGPADFELRAGGGEGSPPHPPSSVSQVRPNFEYRSAGPADVELRAGGGEGSPPHPPLFLAPCFLASQTLVRPTQTFLLGPDPRATYTDFPFGQCANASYFGQCANAKADCELGGRIIGSRDTAS